MACRTLTKAETAKKSILSKVPNGNLTILPLDLGDLNSIRNFSQIFLEKHSTLDVLVNNAGIGGIPYRTTKESRVVSVSSIFNRLGPKDFNDLNLETRTYSKWSAYGRSKWAIALFSNELNRKLAANNYSTVSTCVHPGYSNTNLQGRGTDMKQSKFEALIIKYANIFLAQSEVMGALPSLYAATSVGIKGGG